METRIKKIQTAIFIKNFQLGNEYEKSALLLKIKEKMGSIFDGEPIMLPIPIDAPAEIPRIILNSKDGLHVCNIALKRADIFYNLPNGNTDGLGEVKATQKDNSTKLFNFLKEQNGTIVNRVGFIVAVEKILSQDEGSGCEYLRNKFVNNERFQSPKELVFRYNRAGKSENFEMNNLIIINGKHSKRIAIQTDINTVAEIMNTANFDENNFNEIIDYAIQTTQKLINDFPNI